MKQEACECEWAQLVLWLDCLEERKKLQLFFCFIYFIQLWVAVSNIFILRFACRPLAQDSLLPTISIQCNGDVKLAQLVEFRTVFCLEISLFYRQKWIFRFSPTKTSTRHNTGEQLDCFCSLFFSVFATSSHFLQRACVECCSRSALLPQVNCSGRRRRGNCSCVSSSAGCLRGWLEGA